MSIVEQFAGLVYDLRTQNASEQLTVITRDGSEGCGNTTVWCNITNSNLTDSAAPAGPPYDTAITTILAILAGITSFCTTVGNIMVVVSFILERNIRQPSNYLIASLAVTDILIGSLSMPLYTLYLLKASWPLGDLTCDLWLSLDYTVCLVSQYTVFLITLDRFCSVKVPAKYRNWRTKTKIKVMIAATWIIPTLIFFTSIMGWHHFVKSSVRTPGVCYAAFQESALFSAILVICYYWITLIIMIVLYAGIYRVALALHTKARETKKRIQLLSQNSYTPSDCAEREREKLLPSADATPGVTPSTNTDSSQESTRQPQETCPPVIILQDTTKPELSQMLTVTETKSNYSSCNSLQLPVAVQELESPVWKPRGSLPSSSIHWNAFTGGTYHTVDSESTREDSNKDASRSPSLRRASRRLSKRRSDRGSSTNRSDYEDDSSSESSDTDTKPAKANPLTALVTSLTPNAAKLKRQATKRVKSVSIKRKNKSENRARKALRTITFILGAFVVCWTPYHVIVLLDSFCKSCKINARFYEFSYWLCYMNSPLNPFCYALSSPQFKKSFLKILKLEYFRECWQKVNRTY